MTKSQKIMLVLCLTLCVALFASSVFAAKNNDNNTITVKKENYTLTITTVPNGTDNGEIIVKVTTPKTAKVNKEYPNKLMATPSAGVTLEKNKLRGKDAKTLTADTIEMVLKYKITDASKAGTIETKFKFGVCNMKGGEIFSCQFFTEKHTIKIPLKK